ncbi:MAG: autoinducer binding domain-containing protein [Rhodospirillaceae bacterium]|nr:autoinducer binding domain-containing protein [Rhodospirillaceae bacterium]
MPHRLTDLAKAFGHSATLDDVRQALERCANSFGCREYTYLFTDIGLHQDRSMSEIETAAEFVTNLNTDWTKRYIDRQYFGVDPVVRACYQSRMPIVWSAASAWDDVDPRVMDMLMDAYENGLRRGISVPIHGFAGSFGIFSLYSPADEDEFRVWAENTTFEIQRFAFWFHDFFAARFSHHKAHAPEDVRIRIKFNSPVVKPTLH